MTGMDAMAPAIVPTVFGGHGSVEVVLWSLVLVSGLLGALGAAYLLYVDTIVVHYTRFFRIIAAGLLVFVATAPVVYLFAVELIHAVHALAAAVISVGLYTLIRAELASNELAEAFDAGDPGGFEESFGDFDDEE
ncbi:hypothetical protein JCM17823_08720 [Halorubrum gandharaense]